MAPSAIVTGAASGIGRAVADALAAKGYNLTLLDLDEATLRSTARDLTSRNSAATGIAIRAARLDVTDAAAQKAAFAQHVAEFGSVQAVVLNAGIGERGSFFDPSNTTQWQTTLDVDLTAVLYGVKAAVEVMGGGGSILAVASAGAIFPMPVAPVYAAAKAGVAHFVRSAARGLANRPGGGGGIRLMALCPEFVETPLVTQMVKQDPETAKRLLGSLDIQLLPPAFVAGVAVDMLTQGGSAAGAGAVAGAGAAQYKPGAVVLIRQDRSLVQPYAGRAGGKTIGGGGGGAAGGKGGGRQQDAAAAEVQRQALAAWASGGLPREYKKIVITQLSSKFREAARLVAAPLPPPAQLPAALPAGALLVRRVYAGVNASDVNYSSGRYHASKAEAQSKLPYDSGFESVNVVLAAAPDVKGFRPGDCVAALSYGSFSEYGIESARTALPVPCVAPELVALLTSGLTASIALEQAGRIQPGETVLVTAAAGGTGQFAVQLAKAAGCHVVATCGGPDKAQLLKELGADRVIDYKRESVKAVLKSEYPKGVDVVWESVGGDMFDTAVNALATRGRVIIIGMMSSYGSGWAPGTYPGLAEKLLWKSAAAVGFFLLRYAPLFREHLSKLTAMWAAGRLRVALDPRRFVGVESVFDAVDWLQAGGSVGKVVVQLPQQLPPVGLAPPSVSVSGSGSASGALQSKL
ncbi:hypothetical protein CHLRE_16g677950v5 [Chlamydomonas reinhardtii]|uniref:Enoyl reductase (ER) domain-containing protein n=1 Tax=Chlamydomonas reinhardtii TaxID=3055 RepID=A0A2K3CV96_CHLRE|nr:uncharacterized protein CHLRE_16g677950v5 [Chlamydomonas reinhardtii]PNW72202.1 hypothetical protein CHLRE_16g677950v5 [Chlamydomonas reinhardtii]